MTDIAALPKYLHNRIQAALRPGERVVWAGQPIPQRYMKRGAYEHRVLFAVLALAGLLWMVGCVARTLFVYRLGLDLLPLLGLPFLLIGVVGLRMPSGMEKDARFLLYAITSERVLLFGAGEPDALRSYAPAQLQQLERTEYDGGWGDLILETEYAADGDGGVNTERHGLLAIAGVRHVHRLVAALAATLPLAPASEHPSFRKALLAPAGGASLPAALRQALRAELGPGEHLVWAAQPSPASYLKKGYRKWRFFFPWTLFSLVLAATAAHALWYSPNKESGFFMVLGIPCLFLWIGIHHLLAPLRMRKAALGVVHAITTERALTIDIGAPLVIYTYAPAGLVHARCASNMGGSGDLLLEAAFGSDIPLDPQLYRHGFLGIGEVRHVERLIGHLTQSPAAGN